MSLVDSLLLDPYPFHVWITIRADMLPGSGTVNDPYDGSTQSRFDGIMAMFVNQSNVTLHLGAGTFETNGYADGVSGGWQARPGMKLIGSGVGVTTLQLVNATTGNASYFAIGHPLDSAHLVDFFEVSDLTIDCNQVGASNTGFASFGGVRLMGNHISVRRVKLINWGTRTPSQPCFGIALIAADTSSSPVTELVNSGIEDCIAISPAPGNVGPATAFYVGRPADATITKEGFGSCTYIRNCFVDCGSTPDPDSDNWTCRAFSMGWCRGGVVEGNYVRNTDIGGPYQDNASARDTIVRNNYYKNVARGPCLDPPRPGPSLGSGTLAVTGNVGTISGSVSVSGLAVGDRVKIVSGEPAFTGVYAVTSVQQSPAQFTVTTAVSSPTSAGVSSIQKIFGATSRAVIEGNIVELTPQVADLAVMVVKLVPLISFGLIDLPEVAPVAAVWVDDNKEGVGPDYVHGDVIIRNNKSRYVDGLVPTEKEDLAIQVHGAKNLIVSNSVIDSANSTPLQNRRCGSATYFNNLAPNAALVQGLNADSGSKYSELATEAEDAFLLAYLEHK